MSTTSKKQKAQAPTETQPLALANGMPPDFDAMKRAAVVFKIPVPAGSSDVTQRELLGGMRLKMKELLAPVPKSQQLVCQKCGERSTDHTEYCPFCGDLGISDAETHEGAGISNAPEAAEPTQDVEGKLTSLATELDDRLSKISALKLSFVDSTYDMGLLVKEIHDRQLWKARGYNNFKLFAERELPFTRATAYQLVQIVERFDKKTYLEVGFRKLRTIASVDDEGTREQLLSDAKGGASVRQIDQKTRPAKGSSSEKAGAKEKGGEKAAAPPTEQQRVTILGRVDGKPKEAKFKSAKDGKRINSAGKVTMIVADAYAEVEITDDVYLRVGLRVTGKDLVGLSAEFVRAPS